MRVYQSQGRLFKIMIWVGIPTLAAFMLGMICIHGFYHSQAQNENDLHLKQISTQGQILNDMVMSEMEQIQAEVSQLSQLSESLPSALKPTGRITHWSEWHFTRSHPQSYVLKRSGLNSQWNAALFNEKAYFNSIQTKINSPDFLNQEIGFIRLSQDMQASGGSHNTKEWIAFSFHLHQPNRSIGVAVIDPTTAFLSFPRWRQHSTGGHSRGYLIAQDGKVLAHSEPSLNFADFSKLALFNDHIRNVIAGVWLNGSSYAENLNQTRMGASYFRLGKLPLATVVEEGLAAQPGAIGWIRALGFGFLSLLILIGMIVWSAKYLSQHLVKIMVLSPTLNENQEQGKGKEQELGTTQASSPFLKGDEFLILNTPSPPEEK